MNPVEPTPADAAAARGGSAPVESVDPLLFSVARVSTFEGQRALTSATGFFFERDVRLFLVTSRHVLVDAPSGHHPDRIEIVVHTSAVDLTRFVAMSLLLYRDARSTWRQAADSGGEIDVGVIQLDRGALPHGAVLRPFGLNHLQVSGAQVPLGRPAIVVAFPLGFYDTLHHLPVARHATVASAFGVRFQGEGYFLTDARLHRGASGAPVLVRDPDPAMALPWRLIGIHSGRLDMRTREQGVDETLGLNCAWYADILKTLTL